MDPTATRPLPVRCCCPPLDGAVRHPDGDVIHIRTQYTYGDDLSLSKRSVQYRVATDKDGNPVVIPYNDAFLGEEALMEIGVKDWSLVMDDGKPLPVDLTTILLLPPDVGASVSQAINEHWEASKAPVPNPSGAPSPATSPESSTARPNRATRRSRKPSTQS
jgi:hypothetical protein